MVPIYSNSAIQSKSVAENLGQPQQFLYPIALIFLLCLCCGICKTEIVKWNWKLINSFKGKKNTQIYECSFFGYTFIAEFRTL